MFPQPLKGCSDDIAFPCPAEISSNSTEAKEPLGGGIRVRSWSLFMVGRWSLLFWLKSFQEVWNKPQISACDMAFIQMCHLLTQFCDVSERFWRNSKEPCVWMPAGAERQRDCSREHHCSVLPEWSWRSELTLIIKQFLFLGLRKLAL